MEQPSKKKKLKGDATRSEEQEQKNNIAISLVGQKPAYSKPRDRRIFAFGVITARITLALLFGVGLFLSVPPAGHPAARTAFLLSAVISASVPSPLILLRTPLRHIPTPIPS